MKRVTVCVALLTISSGSLCAQEFNPIVSRDIGEAPVDAVWTAWATSDVLPSLQQTDNGERTESGGRHVHILAGS